MFLKVLHRRTIVLFNTIPSQTLPLHTTKRRGKTPLLNKYIKNWNIHTHPCPPSLEASLVVYVGRTSHFALCSQSIHLPCSCTTSYKRFW